MEQTLMIIKPNAVAKAEEIIERVKQEGFAVRQTKTLSLTSQEAEEFYAVHKGKAFFADLVRFMDSGQIVVALLEKGDAVSYLRKTVGATDPSEAAEGTLREIYGTTKTQNAVHASDSLANAKKEIEFFFDNS
jgi:nucleoside-diphosphate kinase